MTDIVERLRGTWAWSHGRPVNPDGPEAADEIELLRKALFEIGDYNRFGWTLQTELARTALEGK